MTGAVVVPGKSDESLLIRLVERPGGRSGHACQRAAAHAGTNRRVCGLGSTKGCRGKTGFTFHRAPAAPLHLRQSSLPAAVAGSRESNPIDLLLIRYFAANHDYGRSRAASESSVDDRDVYPPRLFGPCRPAAGAGRSRKFVADRPPTSEPNSSTSCLADKQDYAEQWMTFWNDALRNAYRGTGYIDGGRTQISTWLYQVAVRQQAVRRVRARIDRPQARVGRIHSRHRVARRGQRQPGAGDAGGAECLAGVHGHQPEMCLLPR